MTFKEFLKVLWAWIVGLFSKPDDPVIPPDPSDTWPDWVKQKFGDWDYLKKFLPVATRENDDIAFWKTIVRKAAIWEETSRVIVKRTDGYEVDKIAYETHSVDPNTGAPWNLGQDVIVLGYRNMIPTNVNEKSQTYADSEKKIEIANPAYHVLRPDHAKLIGYIDRSTGKYIGVEVNYPGL